MRTKTCIILLIAAAFFAAALMSAAAEAPGMRVLDSIKDVYGPVKFDHQKHSLIAGSCAACHHEHGKAEGLPCKQCHSVSRETFKNSVTHGFMPCKNCHGTFDRDNPGMPGLKTAYHRQCFECHRGMGKIGKDPKGCTEMCHAKQPVKAARIVRKER